MKFIEIKAPAKINIGLNIIRKRSDGYHDLETFFFPINDLFDILTFEKSDTFSIEVNSKDLSLVKNNLVVKAKELLEKVSGNKLNVKIKLTKKIPIGAGLGGGSSDAAATLISLNEMYELKLSYKSLVELALQVGSDVPFFIKAKPAIGKSRGEDLKNAAFEMPYCILIINPGIHISTKEAFANITPSPSNIVYEDVFKDFESFMNNKNNVRNDFEKYVFELYPAIKELKQIMLENGSMFSIMSGSGSTVYGIFESIEKAEKTAECFGSDYFKFISRPLTV